MAGAMTEGLVRNDDSPDEAMTAALPTESTSDFGADVEENRTPLDALARLPVAAQIVNRIGIHEFRRRLLHMLPGLLPFVLWAYPHEQIWELPVRVWIVGLVAVIVTFGMRNFGSMLREGESGAASVLYYGLCVLGSLAVAPLHPEFMLIVVVLLAFGDGSATLGGLLLGGPKLFWNRKKSWSGLACFFACGTLTATVVYWGEVDVTWQAAFLVGAGVAGCAAVAESLPIRLDDNLRVGIAAITACFVIVEHNYQLVIMVSVASLVGSFFAWRYRRAVHTS